MSVQAAFAALLAAPGRLCPELRRHPDRLAARYGLSEQELGILAAVPQAAYEAMAREVSAKARVVLGVAMPQTVREAERHHAAALESYLSGTVRTADGDHPLDAAREGRLFLASPDARFPADLRDFARLELRQYELLQDRVAASAARRWEEIAPGEAAALRRTPERVLRGYPMAPATVRVEVFEHDVTAVGAPAEIPAGRTVVLLHRRWSAPVLTYRVGAGTALLMRLCDGSRTGEEVLEAAEVSRDAGAEALGTLAAAGLVVVADPWGRGVEVLLPGPHDGFV
ncbi:hypothetical protein [Streptomyces sp. NPDC001568]|uniref:hypothetical protein n=1 Tax=Streptomyces sp. NPDC001568 TaxID=3364588 RepID=UPI003673A10C